MEENSVCEIRCVMKNVDGKLIATTTLEGITLDGIPDYYKRNSVFFGIRMLCMETLHAAKRNNGDKLIIK